MAILLFLLLTRNYGTHFLSSLRKLTLLKHFKKISKHTFLKVSYIFLIQINLFIYKFIIYKFSDFVNKCIEAAIRHTLNFFVFVVIWFGLQPLMACDITYHITEILQLADQLCSTVIKSKPI